jgi:hypothetical protein
MSHQLNPTIAVIGIDIGKNSFHVIGLDRCLGKTGSRRPLWLLEGGIWERLVSTRSITCTGRPGGDLVNGHPADTWSAGRAIRPKMCYFVGGQGEDSSALILVRGMIGRVLDRFRRT